MEQKEPIKFTRIKSGYSENRRLPILGKIRLGLKQKSARTGKEYPVETPWFVCPPEVQAHYGPEPRELDIMFPVNDPEEIFIQKLAWYGSSAGLRCHGNGEQALRYDETTKAWITRSCPCEHFETGECSEQSHLRVFLPKLGFSGCWQITTGSYHSTVNLNSQIDMIRGLTGGRLALIPMKLRRVPREITHEGKSRTHYTLDLVFDATIEQIEHIRSNAESLLIPAKYQLASPIESNPRLDPVDRVVEEDESNDTNGRINAADLADMTDEELTDVQQKLQAKRAPEATPTTKAPSKEEAKPKPAEKPLAAVNGRTLKEIPDRDWQVILNTIEADPEWADHLRLWKATHRVENPRRMTAAGQHALLTYLRTELGTVFPY